MIGISKDTVASHRKFADKFELPFTLLADPEKEVLFGRKRPCMERKSWEPSEPRI